MQRTKCLSALCWASVLSLGLVTPALAQDDDDGPGPTIVNKGGVEVDLRSFGRMVADDVIRNGNVLLTSDATPVASPQVGSQIQTRGGNVQVNDPGLDNIQIFPGFRPFVEFTQSETSIAANGRNIVATYNTSAFQPLMQVPGGLVFAHRFLSGYSFSGDGGKTWTSSQMPPVPGSIFTFGDPSIASDRNGNFYFSGLGADATGLFTIQVNRSDDGGRTFGPAVVVQQDNGGDKEWIAVGKDPGVPGRDNVYVTWTSFQTDGSAQLRLGKSIDGAASFTTKTIFAPPTDPDPTHPQNSLTFSNPVVDSITGRLYVPFIQFSNSDTDYIRVLASDDAGETFSFLTFNVPGAPLTTVLPVVQSGELLDCGNGGIRLAIHAGAPLAGRFGLRQFVQTSRLVTQPAFAARNGVLYLAWSNSTSSIFGDPSSGSNVLFIRSDDGGATWTAPIQVNPSNTLDHHHVLPALAIGASPTSVHVAFYTQHTDGSVDVDLANSHDRGNSFPVDRTVRVTSSPFVLPPTVLRLTALATPTTNYDRTIQPAYSLGEYLSVTAANGSVYALWGDARNTVTEPVNPLSPLSGKTHTQQDVFFQEIKAQ